MLERSAQTPDPVACFLRNSTDISMDTRRLARLMGALCFEERLQIIGALISVGPGGLDQQALAEAADLSQMAVSVHIDYMLSTDMVKVKYTDAGKRYSADLDLLATLFEHMSDRYGAGARLLPESAPLTDMPLIGT